MINPQVQALVKGHIAVFRNPELANNYANRCIKPHWVVLGDNDGENGEYWVVTPADAQRLEHAGYEMI
ncbi:MAG: hypothetical protein Q7U37_05650 [Gallionella sp.]|nr:hypothetical protein [Gallionella sp.]